MMIDADWCIQHSACYKRAELEALFDRPHTLLEVLTRDDGPWENVTPQDRMWVFWQAASEDQSAKTLERIVTRAVTSYALPHEKTREWAKKWLSGQDRSGEAAHGAEVDAVSAGMSYTENPALFAVFSAAWAAKVRDGLEGLEPDAAWGKMTFRLSNAARLAVRSAASSMSPDAVRLAEAAREERQRQLNDAVDVLTKEAKL